MSRSRGKFGKEIALSSTESGIDRFGTVARRARCVPGSFVELGPKQPRRIFSGLCMWPATSCVTRGYIGNTPIRGAFFSVVSMARDRRIILP